MRAPFWPIRRRKAAAGPESLRRKAVAWLIACTAFWAVSFPVFVALQRMQAAGLPGRSSLFFASLCVCYRFGLTALILAIAFLPSLRNLKWSEAIQGLGLGIAGAAGSFLQVDGTAYTSASTSAFLTQCYCLFIPLVVAVRDRRRPPGRVLAGCLLVMAGVNILSGIEWGSFRMGRGEIETIAAAAMFAAYILWLERPAFAGNDTIRFSIVNFAVQAAVMLPVAAAFAGRPADLIDAYRSPAALGFLASLIFICTLGGYLIMARWQKHLAATQAGVIYCMEPLFTAAVVLFLPGWIAGWTGIEYPNENLSLRMLLGGGLIVGANVLIQRAPLPRKAPEPAAGTVAPETAQARSRCLPQDGG